MSKTDFTTTLVVDQSPQEVYASINHVKGWWSEDMTGKSEDLHDEFEVRFGTIHYSRHKLIEVIPDQKVVWLVTDSNINFTKDKTDWTGTKNIFEIFKYEGKTHVRFTHEGLNPEVECFDTCSGGWNHYLQGSLLGLITKKTGLPEKIKQ